MESSINKSSAVTTGAVKSDNLLSAEELGRSSPDLWPNQVPGLEDYTGRATHSKPPEWKGQFNNEDLKLLQSLSEMSTSTLLAEVQRLHEEDYQLQCEESKEMKRGTCLKVLEKKNKRKE